MNDDQVVLQQVIGTNPLITVAKSADVRNEDGTDDLDDVIDSAGDNISYQISVANVGDTTLSGVLLTDGLIPEALDKNADGVINEKDITGGDTNANGLLDLGETWTWAGEYEVTQQLIDTRGNYDSPVDIDLVNDNLIRNVVFVSTNEGATEDAEIDTTLDYDPQIRVLKSADVRNQDGSDDLDNVIDTAGDAVDYSIRVSNIGNVSLKNVEVFDDLSTEIFDKDDDGVIDASDADSGDNNSNGVLDVGEEWVFNGRYTVTQEDIDSRGNFDGPDADEINDSLIRNETTVFSQTLDQSIPGIDDVAVEIDYRPVIELKKTSSLYNEDGSPDEDGAIDVAGDQIRYELEVKNAGNVTLSELSVVDPLIAASMDKNDDGVINYQDAVGGDGTEDGIFNVGETWVFSGSYDIRQEDIDSLGNYDGPDPGTENDLVLRNFAGATSLSTDAQQITRDTFVDTRILIAPALQVDKEFVNVTGGDGDELADSAGDVLNYRVVVSNTGNVTLTDVSVTDPLTGQEVTGLTLNPGQSQEFLTSYALTQADLDNNGGGDGDIDNTVTADSAQTDEAQDSAEAPIVYAPDLEIVKTASVDEVNEVGDLINYLIAVSNTGNVTLTDVTLSDTLIEDSLSPKDMDSDGVIDGDGDADGQMDIGETWYWTGQYQVTQSDVDAARMSMGPYYIQNTATADSNETAPEQDSENVLLSVMQEYEGLSPGYWKNHPEDWDGIMATDSFESFFFGAPTPGLNWKVKIINGGGKEKFVTNPDVTMAQALDLTGGDAAALARQAVAAVLNVRDEDVTYQYTEDQIVEWVSDALSGRPVDLDDDGIFDFAAGAAAIVGVKDLLDYNNNLELV
jgi:uncharacterized repeat protein (TIGR01451 family)